MKHTIGPWKISKDKNDIENAMGTGVCALYADETAEANARLIAAAPDLLKALKMFVEEVQEDNQDASLMEAFIKAKAAIVKAEGE